MRLLLGLLFFTMSISLWALPKKTLTLDLKDVSVETFLNEVKKQTGVNFLYNAQSFQEDDKVTIKAANESLETILKQVLDSRGLTYKEENGVVAIRKKDVYKHSGKSVSGIVLDEQGQPIIGASILVKGTSTGAMSDMDGKFALNAAEGKTLVISYVGYERQELKARSGMTINMKSTAQNVGEVVVTGMSKMDKRLFTGATDKVNADALIDGLPDISRSLEGRAAGVSVQNVSGTFGTAPKIRVRGATSIYGSSKPLWVVDGVIMEDVVNVSADDLSSGDAETLISSAIAGLNPDDIESFQILKDGSATSIYGARAMAGVIVVTTKKGKAGQNHINYTGEFTSRLIPSYSNFNILNSQDQMSIYEEMREKGWLNFSDVLNGKDYGVYGKMYDMINTYDSTTGQFELANTEEAQKEYLKNCEMRNTNWFSKLFSSNIMQTHAVSLTGGTEKSNYYVSMSAMMDPGWYKSSNVNRYTADVNATYHIFNNLSLNMISSASYRKQKAPGTLSQDVDAVTGKVKRDFDINPYSFALNSSRALDANTYYVANYAAFNELHELETNYIDINMVDTKFQAELNWKPIPELELSVLGALKYTSTSQEHKIKDDSNEAEAYRAMGSGTIRDSNTLLYTDPDDSEALPVSILPQGGIYQRTDNNMLSYNFRATANWSHTFNKEHIVNLFGGMETNKVNRNQTWFNGWGLQYSSGETPFYIYQFFKKSVEDGEDYYSVNNTNERSVAFFANGTYSYKGKYTLNSTVRYEGTNRLGKSRSARWLPTWNIAGAWNVHEENFFKAIEPTMSHLTLRASYSLTGDRGPDDVINSTEIIKAYNPYRLISSDKETGMYIQYLENKNLTYEKKHELNLGLDAGLFNNRINLTFDWYRRNNYDLIGPVNTEGVGGQVIEYANMASMKSHGEELSISTKNIKTRDFGWTTDFIFSHNKNTVTKLLAQAETMDLINGSGFAKKGYPVRSLFSIPFKGLTNKGYPTFLTENGNVTSYDIDFQSLNTNYLKYEGSTDPTVTGSFGNIFTYKGFRLNLYVTYSYGNKIRLDPKYAGYYNDLTSMTKDFRNRWEMSGDETKTNIPVILSYRQYNENSELGYGYNAYNYSDVRVAKGDFIRMKEISLGYDFPKSWLRNSHLSNLSLQLQATNLFLIYADSKLNGQDPEFFNSGGVAAPVPKQFTLTLRAGL
jgi:TonB-linked SusC/RagA family outer membrane protein